MMTRHPSHIQCRIDPHYMVIQHVSNTDPDDTFEGAATVYFMDTYM